jgi:hypothetical protein
MKPRNESARERVACRPRHASHAQRAYALFLADAAQAGAGLAVDVIVAAQAKEKAVEQIEVRLEA